ncbi:DNA-binding anti-repressor SinI [Paenibacillus sp. HB172176]|uniref:DNA-binding anti-repressor SinI n=1 Tax=Paenibacillus sp. HB172176 TaxID=2493690 RepID=UPI001F0D66AB|nr:DNA-binding anti-repressor SinI [Paenibacillus sp. HB172176]
MKTMANDNSFELDAEWVELILLARSKGLTKEEVSKVLGILQEQRNNDYEESAV